MYWASSDPTKELRERRGAAHETSAWPRSYLSWILLDLRYGSFVNISSPHLTAWSGAPIAKGSSDWRGPLLQWKSLSLLSCLTAEDKCQRRAQKSRAAASLPCRTICHHFAAEGSVSAALIFMESSFISCHRLNGSLTHFAGVSREALRVQERYFH